MLGAVLDLLNGAFSGALTLLGANYLLAERLLLCISLVLGSLRSVLTTAATVLVVLVEDLAVFLQEGWDGICGGVAWVGRGVEQGAQGVAAAVEAVRRAVQAVGDGAEWSYAVTAQAVVGVASRLSSFFSLLGSSILLLLALVPRSLYLVYAGVVNLVLKMVLNVKGAALAVKSAPLEAFVGLLAAAPLAYGVYKVSVRVRLRQRAVRWKEVAERKIEEGIRKIRQVERKKPVRKSSDWSFYIFLSRLTSATFLSSFYTDSSSFT